MRIISIIVISLALSGCWEYQEGEKVGTIVRFTKAGFFCKTWEATIVRGGFTDGSGVAGVTTSGFTVEDSRLIADVQRFMESQTPVKVKYKGEVVTFCRSDSDGVFLQSIEPVR